MYETSEAARLRQHPTKKKLSHGRTIKALLGEITPSEAALLDAIWHVNDRDYRPARFLPMARAIRIVEGRERWPTSPAVRAWKIHKELLYYHGAREHRKPPWLAEPNGRAPNPSTLGQLRLVGSQLRLSRGRR